MTFQRKDLPRTNYDETEPVLPAAKFDIEPEGLLTAAEIEEVRSEVKKRALEERKKAARKALMEKFLAEERAASEPAQEMVEIEISAPVFAAIDAASAGIRIDGVPYLQGRTYTVPRGKAETLREAMQRAWDHEEITFGHKDPNAYRRSRNQDHRGQVVSAALLRF